MLFPGQGSQYVGMLRDLACRFPRMQQSTRWLTRSPSHGNRRSQTDLPSTRRLPIERGSSRSEAPRDTRIAQPAIGAVSLGLLAILEDFGIRPELVGGHSFGELTALWRPGGSTTRRWPSCRKRRGGLMAELRRGEEVRRDARGLRAA